MQDFECRIANWSTLPKMADVIVKKGPFLKLYTTYIREFSAVNYHFDECCAKYPKFAKLVRMSCEEYKNIWIHLQIHPIHSMANSTNTTEASKSIPRRSRISID